MIAREIEAVISRFALDEVRATFTTSRLANYAGGAQARGRPAGSPRIGLPA